MRSIRLILAPVVATAALSAATVAHAGDPLGFYLGGSVGESNVRFSGPYNDWYGGGYQDSHVGWKALVGIRPIPVLGAELAYTDFGEVHSVTPGPYYGTSTSSSHPTAASLQGVLYAPMPIPMFDVYAKAGLARLAEKVSGASYAQGSCPVFGCVPSQFAFNTTNTKFAYGVGTQWRIANLALRAEYERVSATYGDPDFLSVGLTWGF